MSNKYIKITRLLLVLSMFGLLSSCGFHLRSDVGVPVVLKNAHISGVAEYAELNQELKRVLLRTGSQVTKTEETARSVIHIKDEKWRKRVLSVDTQGRAAEYELNYQFSFSVTEAGNNPSGDLEQKPGGKVLVPSQKIDLTRDFRFDPNNVLAKDAEEKRIRTEMVRFAVRQMMRRIRATIKYTGS